MNEASNLNEQWTSMSKNMMQQQGGNQQGSMQTNPPPHDNFTVPLRSNGTFEKIESQQIPNLSKDLAILMPGVYFINPFQSPQNQTNQTSSMNKTGEMLPPPSNNVSNMGQPAIDFSKFPHPGLYFLVPHILVEVPLNVSQLPPNNTMNDTMRHMFEQFGNGTSNGTSQLPQELTNVLNTDVQRLVNSTKGELQKAPKVLYKFLPLPVFFHPNGSVQFNPNGTFFPYPDGLKLNHPNGTFIIPPIMRNDSDGPMNPIANATKLQPPREGDNIFDIQDGFPYMLIPIPHVQNGTHFGILNPRMGPPPSGSST